MNELAVLEVNKLGKIYSRDSAVSKDRLSHSLIRSFFGRYPSNDFSLRNREFWALGNIDLRLYQGEAIGIIGFNGSGKTTLLRLLAGQIEPDRGEIISVGKVCSMIDMTSGFQPSSTGRRNIYLRCAMLGMKKNDIDKICTNIIDFSELGDAVDAPISTYSSGMLMRLAFSIVVSLEPNILLIDEVMSVGDFRFRQKCYERMRYLRGKCAFVLVSHSMNDVRAFCDRVIVLNGGRKIFDGDPEKAVELYNRLDVENEEGEQTKIQSILSPQFHNNSTIQEVDHYWNDVSGKHINEVSMGDTLCLNVSYKPRYSIRDLDMGVPIWTADGDYVTGCSTRLQQAEYNVIENEKVRFVLSIPNICFNPGRYVSNLSISDGIEFLYRGANPEFTVKDTGKRFWGSVTIPHKWKKISE